MILTNDLSWNWDTNTKWFGASPFGTGKMKTGEPLPLDISSEYCLSVSTVETRWGLAWWYSFQSILHVSAFSFSKADNLTISLSFLGHGHEKLKALICYWYTILLKMDGYWPLRNIFWQRRPLLEFVRLAGYLRKALVLVYNILYSSMF